MDATRLRTAAGDANRSAQSFLRHTAADPDKALEQLVATVHVPELNVDGSEDTPYALRAAAREHILWAVAYMDAARQLEARASGAA